MKYELHYKSIDLLRLILMFFVCLLTFGCPTQFGPYLQTFCGFAPIAFFITSGYLVLSERDTRKDKIVRTIKKTAIVFGVLLVVYFIINLIYYYTVGVNPFAAFGSKRFWFNFIVMNVWQYDIGSLIWYVQSLLYAYIIIYFIDKFKLMKYDWIIMIVCLVITVLTGEFAGIVKLDILGYHYIPGNFLTRALPYLLMGRVIHKNINYLRSISSWVYFIIGIVGIFAILAELLLLIENNVLVYYGHFIGMPMIAFSVCMFAFKKPDFNIRIPFIQENAALYSRIIYYICQPLAVIIVFLVADYFTDIEPWLGILVFINAFLIAFLYSVAKSYISSYIASRRKA